MAKLYWGTTFAETDVRGLWAHVKVRPDWYWFGQRVILFSKIVWRRWEPGWARIDRRTAWTVSEVAIGMGPCEVTHG